MPYAPPVYVRAVMDCLNSLGVRPSSVLSDAGLTWQDLCDGRRMVDFAVFRRIVAHSIRSSGEPDLGLIVGSMLQPYHTRVGIAAVTSSDVGQGLQLLGRYAKLIFGCLDFELLNGPRQSSLMVKSTIPLGDTHVFVTQTILGAHCRLLEAMLGRPADEPVVGLPYPRAPGSPMACARYVRSISFDRDRLSMELPMEVLHTPCVGADPNACSEATQACQRMESELFQGAFVHRVKTALVQRLAVNPNASEVASVMGVSPRTLVRKLAEAGKTYSEIKDDLRRTHATWFLQHTELSIEGISSQLGYADPTTFARKFKSWYQTAPSKMRQAMGGTSQ
jgi:AraC-like DNA-binding protein